MTPGTKARSTSVVAPGNQLEAARARLHVAAVPDSLPCRDNEFTSIFNFVKGNLTEGMLELKRVEVLFSVSNKSDFNPCLM